MPPGPIAVTQPDFICVGAAKSGSTSLHEILAVHPDIWLPAAKELHFFDNPDHYARGMSWYREQFSAAPANAMVGEVTPAYLSYPEIPARMREHLGDALKLIFLFREPVSRAYSGVPSQSPSRLC